MTRYEWPNQTDEHDDRDGREGYRDSLGVARIAEVTAPSTLPTTRSRSGARVGPLVAPRANADLWAPIGPSSSLRGQPADDGRVSGRVVDVWAHPNNTGRVYAATAGGGVWFSPDNGATWRALGGWAPAPTTSGNFLTSGLSCGAMWVEFRGPSDGSQDIVWVGSGERGLSSEGTPGDRLAGIGVLRGVGPATKAETDNTAFVREAATTLTGKGCFKLALEPDGQTMLVASTEGLRQRPSGAGPHADWPLIAGHPMTTDANPTPLACVDVVWTPAVSGKPKRVWAVFLLDDGKTSLQFQDIGTGVFNSVTLGKKLKNKNVDAIGSGRLGAAADGSLVWLLGHGPRIWRVATTDATPAGVVVGDTPNIWDGSATASKIAIGVDPTSAARVVVGGTVKSGDYSAASLFFGTVTAAGVGLKYPTESSSFVGDFVHPDVMAIRFSDDGQTMWVATDGGVYQSTRAGANKTFVAKNDGLAVLECGFVASHPEHDGVVVVGLQDNGTQRRIGETAWRADDGGDGGGVAFDLANPHRYIGQYINSAWSHGVNPAAQPVQRAGHSAASYKTESDAASFYSSPGVIAKDTAATQLAIGTNRVWYTENWGQTWRTLPTGVNDNKDARGNKNKIDDTRDVLAGGSTAIYSCRWASKDRLWVLTGAALFRYDRDSGGTWSSTPVSVNPLRSRQGKKSTTVGDTPVGGPTAPTGNWLEIAPHTATTLYLAAAGVPTDATSDQLFWFDGVSTWRTTGLRTLTSAGALSVAVEPGHEEFVYVGTTIGVFRGHLEFDDGVAEWTWARLDNGLPDVAVNDLSIYSRDGVRLLRAATQSRGVWELDLSGTVTNRTYLRVHPLDTRRRLPTPLADPTVAKIASKTAPATMVAVEFPWHASPDIRVHPRLQVEPRPASLPWTAGKHPSAAKDRIGVWRLWQFQAALRALDARSEPNGGWPSRFTDTLARAGAPLVSGKRTINGAFWDTVMSAANVASLPWDGARPSEADLLEWLPDIDDARPIDVPSTSMPAGPATVQILLHDRGFPAVAPADVRVALLRKTIGPWKGTKSNAWAAGNVGWTTAVRNFLTSSGAAPTLADGWQVVTSSPSAVPLAPVTAGSPQAVSFDTDFTGTANDSLVLLVAVVSSSKDEVAMAEAPLRDLTLANHHVAVRSVRIVV